MDRSKWRKLIKDVRWTGWVFVWYWPTWVVPDQWPLNGCVCVCVCSYLLHYSGQFACQLIAKLYVVRKFEWVSSDCGTSVSIAIKPSIAHFTVVRTYASSATSTYYMDLWLFSLWAALHWSSTTSILNVLLTPASCVDMSLAPWHCLNFIRGFGLFEKGVTKIPVEITLKWQKPFSRPWIRREK